MEHSFAILYTLHSWIQSRQIVNVILIRILVLTRSSYSFLTFSSQIYEIFVPLVIIFFFCIINQPTSASFCISARGLQPHGTFLSCIYRSACCLRIEIVNTLLFYSVLVFIIVHHRDLNTTPELIET